MDVNSNRSNQHHHTTTSSKPRHISRLKKEMLEHRMQHNPFSSPPSSTGSHDTVSTTTEELTRNLSNFSFSPDDEGTRKFSQDMMSPYPAAKRSSQVSRSGRFGSRQAPSPNKNKDHLNSINTSAIARSFPEWSGLLNKNDTVTSQTFDFAGVVKTGSNAPVTFTGGKENVPPARTAADLTEEQTTFDNPLESKRKRARADMQARVENESDCSTVLSLSLSPGRQGSRRSRFANVDGVMSPEQPKKSLQDMVSKIRTEKQNSKQQRADSTPRRPTPAHFMQPPTHQGTPLQAPLFEEKSGVSPTGRSFFLPGFRHLPDWTAGALRFSAMKDGVPVFVKSKSGVRFDPSAANSHGAVNAVAITEEDEEIFVSMDKLQHEVRELHDHDAMLQREAEKLQREVNQLQSELKRFKSRHPSDSAIGSDSDASFRRSGGQNPELEGQIAELRSRLDHASQKSGVHDIHSAALSAERDEALRQASIARERAAKLQAELEGTQRDLEYSLQFRQDKETLEVENGTLLAENESLRQHRDEAIQDNRTLTAENDKLRRELAGVQKDLKAAREELASVRKRCEALKEEKRLYAEDHQSMERNNDTYFKENKKLQAQVAARDQHIADLKKGISTRDKMIDNIQSLTTDTAVLELNADLEAELESLSNKLEQLTADGHEKDGDISAKEGRIRSLKEHNLDLSLDNERLRDENQRLREVHEELRGQWVDERHKVARLNQFLSKNNNDHEDCVQLEDDFRQKENDLRHKLARREAAVKKVKMLTAKITEIAEQEFTALSNLAGKSTARVKVVDPKDFDDFTVRSSNMNVEEDPTTELHMTQESDFASIMEDELAKLKQTYRDLQRRQQESTQQLTDYSLPPLPTPGLQRSKSDSSAPPSKATQQKAQPPGILKKSSQFATLEEDTGRFSVRSAMSFASHHTDDGDAPLTTNHSRKSSVNNTGNVQGDNSTRLRRNSENTTRDAGATGTIEPNMTSAFFLPDITQQQQHQSVPSLSKDARRVLDTICNHKSGNCNVCVRIAAHGEKHQANTSSKIQLTPEELKVGKKKVCVEKPVPVSDRNPEESYRDEPTLRPSMPPGEALAICIKETQDEIEHMQMELKRLNDVYFSLDKSVGQRERRRVMGEIKRLQADLEAKSGQLYRLHDVLEGQKQAGQTMEREDMDVTVLDGLVGVEAAAAAAEKPGQGRREVTATGSEWEGFE
ncbi:hypothetical protein QBC35DRAFT_374925 [Podospora australis]|uniref:Uncharacterized protein n=1 Tax=Podospora australis TaxID=1536484 RepID=A0AAN6X114_9PEZI|nr:hypothetical protein QBC35DRAFT_374925 [Podospora australis]